MVQAAAGSAGAPVSKGLEGVVAAATSLSLVDGANGRLFYRGYPIEDVANQASFEEVALLLWDGDLPPAAQLDQFEAELAARRALPDRAMRLLRELSPRAVPIAALRTIVSALEGDDPQPDVMTPEAVRDKGLSLLARMTTIVAAQVRLRQGLEPAPPDPALGHAANFLWMLTGQPPDPLKARAFDVYLVLLAEHSLNASTFTARVTASTGSDVYAVITAALAALKGDAHGGANQRALEMLREIGSPDRVEEFIEQALATRRRVMGIGHRIYRVRDPRAPILEEQVQTLMDAGGERRLAEIARTLDKLTTRHPYYVERHLSPNVEFYSAPLLDLIGIPTDVFPAVFGCSRIVGWIGHLLEQLADNRLIRPAAAYVGPEPRAWVPLAARG